GLEFEVSPLSGVGGAAGNLFNKIFGDGGGDGTGGAAYTIPVQPEVDTSALNAVYQDLASTPVTIPIELSFAHDVGAGLGSGLDAAGLSGNQSFAVTVDITDNA